MRKIRISTEAAPPNGVESECGSQKGLQKTGDTKRCERRFYNIRDKCLLYLGSSGILASVVCLVLSVWTVKGLNPGQSLFVFPLTAGTIIALLPALLAKKRNGTPS
jgi:hypothetical protein